MTNQRYLVSARKHRPQQFSELVAQQHVAQTLQNALRLNKLAHAYLFSGPRGVGKTTAARILAKAINCDAGGQEPCRSCGSCEDFELGRSLSIFEIDAASNNKVEDVRELQETVQFPPQGARKKVYIVDEVHMLSKPAFNALLKTLEEPPPHVLFIFATTEPHKVLPTILSRCQRFDFRRIPVQDIVAQLKKISAAEGIAADEESLLLLARKGDGALRDALSAFDQAIALCGTDLQYAALAGALGVVDVELFFAATDHVANRSRAGMLRLVDTLMRSGHDIQEFLSGLAEHLRNLLVAQSLQDLTLLEASASMRNRYMLASDAFSEPTLLRLMMAVEEAQRAITTTAHTRFRLELALLKMASMQDALVLTDALNRVDKLIALAESGKLPSGNAYPSAPKVPATTTHQSTRRRGSASERSDVQRGYGSTSEPQPPPPEKAAERPSVPRPKPRAQLKQDSSPEEAIFGKPSLERTRDPKSDSKVSSPAGSSRPVGVHRFAKLWPEFVQRVKQDSPRIGSMLEQSKPRKFQHDTLYIGVPTELHKNLCGGQASDLIGVLAHFSGASPRRLSFEILPELQEQPVHDDRPFDAGLHLRQRTRDEPIVRALVEKFGAEVVW